MKVQSVFTLEDPEVPFLGEDPQENTETNPLVVRRLLKELASPAKSYYIRWHLTICIQ